MVRNQIRTGMGFGKRERDFLCRSLEFACGAGMAIRTNEKDFWANR